MQKPNRLLLCTAFCLLLLSLRAAAEDAVKPAPAPAEAAAAPVLDNEQLIAGLALAADRLRAQTPVVEEAAPEAEAAPQPQPEPEAAETPVAEAAAEPAPAAAFVAPEEPWAPRPGGFIERLGRAFRRRS